LRDGILPEQTLIHASLGGWVDEWVALGPRGLGLPAEGNGQNQTKRKRK